MYYHSAPEGKDPHLWNIARRRTAFKRHLTVYLIINLFLWAIWYFTGTPYSDNGIPWPVWSTFGWGIGLAFHYMGAYVSIGSHSIEKEYDRLVENKNKQ